MLSTKELFYGPEPIWILRAEKNDENKTGSDQDASTSKDGPVKVQYPIYTSIPYHPYYNYNPENTPTPAKKDDDDQEKTASKGTDKKKETTVVMKVPICCSGCEASINVAIHELKGIKSVECNSLKERVTVVATTAAPADILMQCRKVFKKSRMWSDDD